TMFVTKLKSAAVVLVVLTYVGMSAGIWFLLGKEEKRPLVPPPAPRGEKADKPELPKEWAGRWVVDPFAGAESIEVKHVAQPGKGLAAGGGATYVIKDPKALAVVLKAVKVEAVHNDIGIGSIPPAHLNVRKKDGSTFRAGVEGDGALSCDGGLV